MKKLNLKKVVAVVLVGLLVGGLLGGIYHVFFNPVKQMIGVLEDNGYNVVVTKDKEPSENGFDVTVVKILNLDDDVEVGIYTDGNDVVGFDVWGDIDYFRTDDDSINEGVQPFWVLLSDTLEQAEVNAIDDDVTDGDTKVVTESGVTKWGINFEDGFYFIQFFTHEADATF